MKVLAIFGVVVVLVVIAVIGLVGFQNDANRFEIDIQAQYKRNQNIYDNGWKEVVEKAQVPEMYTEKLKELYDGTMKGRYGEKGSQALLQFITEQNPNIDASLYKSIQQSIEIFRNEFQQTQNELIAKKQSYETFLRATVTGRFYNMVSDYPKIDLDKFDIVTSEKTEKTFETKKDEPLKLNGK